MFSAVVRPSLLFLAGILLNMSFLHYFAFMETRSHPFVARSGTPHLASALWATLQLGLGLLILLATGYRFAAVPDTGAVFVGFAFWGILLGMLYDRNRRREAQAGGGAS